jgi:hypothetical protein
MCIYDHTCAWLLMAYLTREQTKDHLTHIYIHAFICIVAYGLPDKRAD